MAVPFVLAVSLVLAGLGWGLVGRLDREGNYSILERLALGLCLGALLLHLAVFAVGHWRLDHLGMGLVAAVFTLAALPGLRAMPWTFWRGAGTAFLRGWRGHPFAILVAGLIIATALSALLQGMAPPNDYDSLMYHLSIPLYDVAAGRMEIAWGWGDRNFFPILVENLGRFALVFSGTGAAQMLQGVLGCVAAATAASLATRMNAGPVAAALAALIFLSIRVVVWEMASLEVEVAQAAFTGAALLAYMELRRSGRMGPALLFGAMLAGGYHTKYTSLLVAGAFAPIMLWDLYKRKIPLAPWIAGPAVSVVLFLPHVLRDLYFTGNPIFPLANPLFNPGAPELFGDLQSQYGVGRDLISHFVAPWAFSVDPLRHFDGVILGSPYLLALIPFAFIGAGRARNCAPAMTVVACFYIAWFHLISQQVRFLTPLFPMLSALAAIGAASLWRSTESAGAGRFEAGSPRGSSKELNPARAGRVGGASDFRPLRAAMAACFLTLACTQAMFVGIYAMLRLPPALGLKSAEDYLTKTPTMDGSHYLSCRYVAEHLAPGQKYLSLLTPHFATCPPYSAVIRFKGEEWGFLRPDDLPPYTPGELLEKLDQEDIRLIIFQTRSESRRNDTAQPVISSVDLNHGRISSHLLPAMQAIGPVFSDKFTDVYDGVGIREFLRQSLKTTR
jgi:hypothetical protein